MKRFIFRTPEGFAGRILIRDTYTHEEWIWTEKAILDRLNRVNEEREYWKHACVAAENENQILWNEMTHLFFNKGVKFSTSFEKYCEKKKMRENDKRKDRLMRGDKNND